MKVLAFVFILVVGTSASVLDSRQTTSCTTALAAPGSEPGVCLTVLAELTQLFNESASTLNFNDVLVHLDDFCNSGCIEPVVDYYRCLGEDDFANVLDGFWCGTNTPGGVHCIQLWQDAYYQNGSNPEGINYVEIIKNCRDPIHCDDTCRTLLNKAKDSLGCCLAAIVEFSSCLALAKVRFEECSIPIPPICTGATGAPAIPAPEFPTSRTGCVHPLDDPDYPSGCKDNLTAVEKFAVTQSESGFTSFEPSSTDVPATLAGFCVPECVRPLVAYYNCTGEPEYANAINGFFCGKEGNQYCIEKLPTIFERFDGSGGPVDPFVIQLSCNNVLNCSTECMTELTEAKREAGCCLAGAVEFTVCGPLEQVRFDECGIDVGSFCTGVDLSSGGQMTVPFSFTLLSLVIYLTFMLA